MLVEASGKPPGCKLLRVSAEVSEERESLVVLSLSVRGDFFATPEEGFEEVVAGLPPLPLEKLASAFDEAMTEKGILLLGISGLAVFHILRGALDGL